MKTFNKNREFLVFHKFLAFLFVLPFFVFVAQNNQKTSNSEIVFSKKSSTLLSSVKNSQTEVQKASETSGSSIFTRVLAGIGSFFVVIGSGIATGITSTVRFIGKVIALPVTATLSLFSSSRNQEDTRADSGTESTGVKARNG